MPSSTHIRVLFFIALELNINEAVISDIAFNVSSRVVDLADEPRFDAPSYTWDSAFF